MLSNFPAIVSAPNDKTVPTRTMLARRNNSCLYNVAIEIVPGQFLSWINWNIFPI